jgi:hypothetical protein
VNGASRRRTSEADEALVRDNPTSSNRGAITPPAAIAAAR